MNVAIVGSTGYSGLELIRLLHVHPQIDGILLYANSHEGKELTEVAPHLTKIKEAELASFDANKVAEQAELVFFATPSGISSQLVPQALQAGLKVIDLSGDFRLLDPANYRTWYGKEPAESAWLEQAVYGLCEWSADKVKEATFISNPGCYPTAALLGLLPLYKHQGIDPKSVIIDAKSGVSGAGRTVSAGAMFSEVNDSISAYKVARHQHTPEIEQTISLLTGTEGAITFTPHLVPMTRGILCTMYATLKGERTWQEIREWYDEAYGDKQFVRLRPEGNHPKTKEVYGSNYCDIAFHLDQRTGRIVILSVIDNVMKGASGQAVQNMNLMMGWPEETGLQLAPIYP